MNVEICTLKHVMCVEDREASVGYFSHRATAGRNDVYMATHL
jgi:hypothetical protein